MHAAPARSPIIAKGDTITVQATGVVKETDMKFWSTKDPGAESFAFQAGVGGVIVGWDQGCLGMKIGETRLLDIPSEEAYGEGGFDAWSVPPNAGAHNLHRQCQLTPPFMYTLQHTLNTNARRGMGAARVC